VYYGPLDDAAVQALKAYELVIVHPDQAMNSTTGITAAILASRIRELKAAGVIVIAYISVGEDLRVRSYFSFYAANTYPGNSSAGWHPDWAALQTDQRFYRGDDYNYVGPVLDPRGALDGGGPLDGYYRWPGLCDTGWAPYYLDDGDRNWITGSYGLPDYNLNFGAFFVNIGDRLWYETLRDQSRSVDGLFGMDELLSSDGLAFDGLFLDTIDTMGPNTYTNAGAPVPSEFEWTAPGLLYFIQNLRRDHPDILVVQNRGLFFFDPRLAHHRHAARGLIDYVMFESYRLDSSIETSVNNSAYYRENQKRIRQALMVEACRPDGFQVLSLGYVAVETDEQEVAADIAEANASGFVHYITNPVITELRIDALNARSSADTAAPVWSTTGYVNTEGYPDAYNAALIPRVGISNYQWGVQAGYDTGNFRLYYDIALDRDPVTYVAYRFNLDTGTLLRPDLTGEPWWTWAENSLEWQEFFQRADEISLVARIRPEYEDQYGQDPYTEQNDPPLAYWSEIPETIAGVPYLFLLRARDASGNETDNINILKLTIPE
jgi:endo-alpha-1,4-polygalactosaminidase (GH114 family)